MSRGEGRDELTGSAHVRMVVTEAQCPVVGSQQSRRPVTSVSGRIAQRRECRRSSDEDSAEDVDEGR